MKRYFIIAGDPSADSHGANLINAIKKIQPETYFYGIGGNRMIEAGLQSIVPLNMISVVGFWEVAKKYFFFKNLLQQCKTILQNDKPDAFIPIDYPGFNIRLSGFAKSKNIPVVYYIAPQLWAWGKDRAAKLKGIIDKLLVVFPFEVDFFAKFGLEADFVGHPILDNRQFQSFPENNRDDIIAFFPGSRTQEVKKHLSLFGKILSQTDLYNKYRFIIAKSSNVSDDVFLDFRVKYSKIEFGEDSQKILKSSKLGLIKTGTSNLEAALLGLPFAMYYKTSALSYLIAKNLVNISAISIVNILANKPVVKEFIQNDINAEQIELHIEQLFYNSELRANLLDEFRKIRENLGGPGASARAAQIITGLT